jgi:lipopolysaccharide export system permease protein
VRLLDRYLFRELLTPLATCLGGFLLLYISFYLFNDLPELQERKLHFLGVLEYCVALTPSFLVLVLPVALLLALLYTLTNHARHNEITAMRAAGISLWRICLPYFLVGLLATAASFALNELLVPRSADWALKIKTRYVKKAEDERQQSQAVQFGLTNQRAHRQWFIGRYDARTMEMSYLTVNWPMPDGSLRQLDAARAVRTNGVWTFFDVTEKSQANADAPLVKLLQTNVLAMPEFDETPRQIQGEIKMGNYETINARTETIPLNEILEYMRHNPQLRKEHASDLMTIFHGRLAGPWKCLVVVMIAIPFGAASGRRNLFFGVAGSIFIVAGYLVTESVSLAFGAHGQLPAWLAAWLPNLIFGGMGVWLTSRVR